MPRPRLNSKAQNELNAAEEKFDEFKEQCTTLSQDAPKDLPVEDRAPQTQMSRNDLRRARDLHLKPSRTIFPSANPKTQKFETFNERYRKDYEQKKEYIQFIAENKEIIGETLTVWTKPFAGIPAEEWSVPVNQPVWGPRYLYDKIRKCRYTRLFMDESRQTSTDGNITHYGQMVAKSKIQRLDAYRVEDGEMEERSIGSRY